MIAFENSKITLPMTDINTARIWDSVRDTDGGAWREKWKFPGLLDESKLPSVKTLAPSTMLVLGRTGLVSLIDVTEKIVPNEYGTFKQTFANLLGPIRETDVVYAHAAEGCVAAVANSKLFLFDLYDGKLYTATTSGVYLTTNTAGKHWFERWRDNEIENIQLGGGLASAPTGEVVCSRATVIANNNTLRVRVMVFCEAGDKIVCLNSFLNPIVWSNNGWTVVDDLNVLPTGEIIFSGGVDAASKKSFLLKPESWYWPTGSQTCEAHASINFKTSMAIDNTNTNIYPGMDEVGLNNGVSTVVATKKLQLGNQNIIADEWGFGPKIPGCVAVGVCGKNTPETDALADNSIFTKTGTLTKTKINGYNRFSGWSGANYLECDYTNGANPLKVADIFADRWACSAVITRTANSAVEEVIMEYGYAPSGYSGAAAKLYIDSGVLKFAVTENGYTNTVNITGRSIGLNNREAVMCGYDGTTYFLGIGGEIYTENGGALPANPNAKIRLGLGINNANPLTNYTLSHVQFAKNGMMAGVLDALRENINFGYGKTEITATAELIGGDDEFGSYYFISDGYLYKVLCGDIISKTSLTSLGLHGATSKKLDIRGWRLAAQFVKNSKKYARYHGHKIILNRSEYENMLTQRKINERSNYVIPVESEEDFTGPRIAATRPGIGVFEVDAIINWIDGSVEHFESVITIAKIGSANPTITENFNVGVNSDVQFNTSSTGGYITLVNNKTKAGIWYLSINRIK